MEKMYYRNEWTEAQWRRLIDYAQCINCRLTFNNNGVRINSTWPEDFIIRGREYSRYRWSEYLHGLIEKAANDQSITLEIVGRMTIIN